MANREGPEVFCEIPLSDREADSKAGEDVRPKNFTTYSKKAIKRSVDFSIRNRNSLLISIGLGVISYFVAQKFFVTLSNAECFLVAFTITVILAGLFVNSKTARCIGALLLPSLGSRVTKGILMAAISAVILIGPMGNVIYNIRQTTSSLTCFAELAVNKSVEAFGDTKQLVQQVQENIKNSPVFVAIKEFDKTGKSIQDTIKYQKQKLEEQVKEIASVFQMCQSNLKTGVGECENSVDQVRSDCKSKFEGKRKKRDLISWLENVPSLFNDGFNEITKQINDPFNDLSSQVANEFTNIAASFGEVCDIFTKGNCYALSAGGNICNALQHISSAPLKLVDEIAQMPIRFVKLFTDVDAQLSKITSRFVNSTVKEAKRNIAGELNYYYKHYRRLKSFSDNLSYYLYVAATILMVFSACFYYHQYHKRVSFDNVYITSDFLDYDKGHSETVGKANLFPLRWPQEGENLIVCSSIKPTAIEFKMVVLGSVKFFAIAFVVMIAHLLDWVFYVVLDTIKKNGQVKIEVKSNATINYGVEGGSIVALLLRSMVQSDGFTLNLASKVDTNHCLPIPREPSGGDIAKSVILLVFILAIIVFQPYLVRARQWIAGYFYPERRLERYRYLYDKMQRQREAIKINLYDSRMDILDENEEISKGIEENSALTNALRLLGLSRRHCVVCQERESVVFRRYFKRYVLRDGTYGYRSCKKCPAFYCNVCWRQELVCHICDNPIVSSQRKSKFFRKI